MKKITQRLKETRDAIKKAKDASKSEC